MKSPNGMYVLYSAYDSRRTSSVSQSATPASILGALDVYGGLLRIQGTSKVGDTTYISCSANGKAYGEPFKAGVIIYAALLVNIGDRDDFLQDTLLTYGAVATVPVAANAIVNVVVEAAYAD